VRTLHGLWVLSLCGLPVGGCCQRSASVAAVLLFCWRCASLERRTEEGKDTCCLMYLRAEIMEMAGGSWTCLELQLPKANTLDSLKR
jgi:hypothetical protein